MGNFEITNPVFNGLLRKLETSDPNHADVFNNEFRQLIENDLALKKIAEEKAPSDHTHQVDDIDNFPESMPANGGDADTVDKKHATDFVSYKKRNLTAAELNNPSYGEPYIGSLTRDTAIAIGLPGYWYHIVYFRHEDNNGYGAQIAISLDATNMMFLRTSLGTGWAAWQKITPSFGTTVPASLLEGELYYMYE